MTLDEILSTPAVSTDPEPLISRTLLSGEAGTTLVERLVSGLPPYRSTPVAPR